MGDGQRTRQFGVGAAVVLGGAVAIGMVLWTGWGLIAYLLALALAALGMLVCLSALPTTRWRVLGTMLLVLALALAVVVPWRVAALERSGDPLWVLRTDGLVGVIHSDGERMLFTDQAGLHAVDVASGEELWVQEASTFGGARGFEVAADGHVLARFSGSGDSVEARWISPEGELLWTWSTLAGEGVDLDVDDRAFADPIASLAGTLVVTSCADRRDESTCRVVGIGPDGAEVWSMPGQSGAALLSVLYRQTDLADDAPREIPEVGAVFAGRQTGEQLGPVSLVDPATGSVLETTEAGTKIAVLGDVVVVEGEPSAQAGMCRLRGWSASGEVDWEEDAPCLDSSVAVGDWIYAGLEIGDDDAAPDDAEATAEEPESGARARRVGDAAAIDPATGAWQEIGPLAYFSVNADAVAGVPGTDVVVQRQQQRLRGVDPATAEEIWTLEVPGGSIPGVDAAHGAVAVYYAPEGDTGRNPFLVGEDQADARRVLAVDSATGRVTGSLTTTDSVWWVTPVAPGRVAVFADDRLSLIGERAG
ncbi:hypothetical protein V1260_07900 [Brachybacterium sp. J144]|uniref:hypothetical protein n=1 Tax=Brachybacterium sp. J144 TaxID=3116487 RepID=UPI002E7921EB|nr:hypothetical protein [Brachybacterium sp. J144]MEE1650715.1 hypothetical protein [Brachybacterium sp. J144]